MKKLKLPISNCCMGCVNSKIYGASDTPKWVCILSCFCDKLKKSKGGKK